MIAYKTYTSLHNFKNVQPQVQVNCETLCDKCFILRVIISRVVTKIMPKGGSIQPIVNKKKKYKIVKTLRNIWI